MANKIYTNHTLQEYKKKYGNNKNLKKINKVEVISNKSLLNGKSWWLIDDTYYEIPSNKVKVWWSNLGKGGQIAICALLGAGVATAVVVPTVIAVNNHKSTNTAVIDGDEEVKNNITVSKGEVVSEGTKYIVTSKTTKEFGDLIVTMGNDTLKQVNDFTKGATNEYKINKADGLTFNIIISKETIDAHANIEVKITIKLVEPVVEKKINLNKTSIEVNVYGSEEIVASLSDKGTGLVTAEGKSDIVTITAKGNNTFSIKGVKEGSTTITFECDGYESATLNVTVKKAITKAEWVEKAKEFNNVFLTSSDEYTLNDVDITMSTRIDDKETVLETVKKRIVYDNEVGFGKGCALTVELKDSSLEFPFICACDYEKTGYFSRLIDDKDAKYIIGEDEITYTYSGTELTDGTITKLSINKYGYITCYETYNQGTYSKLKYEYSCAPHQVKKVKINSSFLQVVVGGAPAEIAATLSDGSTGKINVTIDEPSNIIKVIETENNGFIIEGIAEGKTTIRFICEGYEPAICDVTVNPKEETNKDL